MNERGDVAVEMNLYSFQRYLNKPEALTFPEMEEIHRQIMANSDFNNEDFRELWEDVLRQSMKYTLVRSEGMILTQQEQELRDASRTEVHNQVLSSFLILERFFVQQGWKSEDWTKLLFLQSFIENRTLFDLNSHRKRVGDFANYLTFVYALHNR